MTTKGSLLEEIIRDLKEYDCYGRVTDDLPEYLEARVAVRLLLANSLLARRSHELMPSPTRCRKTTECFHCSTDERVVQIGFK
jgi:hypothetical protein